MGLFDKIKQAGRWTDKNVLQNKYAGAINPMILGYQMMSKTGLFAGPKEDDPAAAPMTPPDLTDQAVREAAMRKKRGVMQGGIKSTFLTGPLGDRSSIPAATKSILGD